MVGGWRSLVVIAVQVGVWLVVRGVFGVVEWRDVGDEGRRLWGGCWEGLW